jgi:hypothetical protein
MNTAKPPAAERFLALFLKTRLLFWKDGKFLCKVHCPSGWPKLCENLDDQKNRPKMKEFLWK